MASENDKAPHLILDFEKIIDVKQCDLSFTFPALGHVWIVEKSLDGNHWEVCGIQNEVVARSPHIITEIGETRYLRINIIKGNPGLWKLKCISSNR